jgi:hypothetical protein
MFRDHFPDLPQMKVLDLGGRPEFWLTVTERPAAVTVLNLETPSTREDWISVARGDACDPPPEVRDDSFDLVFSNSLIEHVGGPLNRQRCASFVRGAADRYWVQTPYRYFPVEPHWLFPGFQFLPLRARARITQRWPLGTMRREGRDEAVKEALGTELVSGTEMRSLFPEAQLLRERFAGLTKSIIAVRS